MCPMMTSNSQSSYLSVLNSGITGSCHHNWPELLWPSSKNRFHVWHIFLSPSRLAQHFGTWLKEDHPFVYWFNLVSHFFLWRFEELVSKSSETSFFVSRVGWGEEKNLYRSALYSIPLTWLTSLEIFNLLWVKLICLLKSDLNKLEFTNKVFKNIRVALKSRIYLMAYQYCIIVHDMLAQCHQICSVFFTFLAMHSWMYCTNLQWLVMLSSYCHHFLHIDLCP